MKLLVFLLALGNLLFYAYSQGMLAGGEAGESVRITQQIKPESIRIVARGEPPADGVPAPAGEAAADKVPGPAESAATPVAAASSKDQAPPPAAPASPPPAPAQQNGSANAAMACIGWETLSQTENERVGRVLASAYSEFSLRQIDPANRGWWVFIPPQANKAAADKKGSELKALGIKDYFVIQEGPQRFAVSLGVFSSEGGAREHLAQLQGKGVRSARVDQRPDKEGREARSHIEVRGPRNRIEALQSALTEALPSNPPKPCP